VTAREGAQAGATFTGAESDLDALMQKAAEHVYSVTQPYRYANFLFYRNNATNDHADRVARATVIYRKLISGPSALERAWAWNGLGTMASGTGNRVSPFFYRKAIAASPDFTMGYFGLSLEEQILGHDENSLTASLKAKSLLDRSTTPDINPSQLSLRRLRNNGYLALATGDYGEAVRNFKLGGESPGFANLQRAQFTRQVLVALAGLHDGGGIRAYMLDLGISSIQKRFGNIVASQVAVRQEDWPAILQIEKGTPESAGPRDLRNNPVVLEAVALAHGETGDMKGAEGLIADCPADFDACLIARGQIAERQGQHGRADYWFDRVEAQQPSIPFADAAWGKALLERHQPDTAIEKFKLANRKGPHFADPIEMWGEALMAKNQSHLALAKFAEAEKYAPNWGRLHLKWGEALIYAGKKDGAKAQFARAAQLDLTPSEKTELARHP
jgi:tetratricopeptide (TPR) repeat protein